MLLTIIGAGVGAFLLPANPGRLEFALYPGIGSIIGAIVGFGIIFLVFLFLAPYRQRNEVRTELQTPLAPIPLPNRADLIKAIASVQHAAIEVINQQDTLDRLKAQSPDIVYTELEMTADEAYTTYTQAMKVLDQEQLVAGSAIKQPLDNLRAFISAQVLLKIAKPIQVGGGEPLLLNPVEFAAKLRSMVDGTIEKIDRIIQKDSHKD